ncbi:MAG: DUF4214 domain-containing protein [Clostridiales bacterium]|nr:DUF4214 domain-containing protein [Clostridiales bacterium]
MKEQVFPNRFRQALLAVIVCFSLVLSGFVPAILRAEDEQETDPVAEFVTRAYSLILEREPEKEGFDYWHGAIKKKTMSAAFMLNGFMTSPEFQGRNLSKEEQLDIVYHVMFDREPDEGGFSYWMGYMKAGVSITAIINGFAKSEEFTVLCEKYGIVPGKLRTGENRDLNMEVTAYVARVYNILLEREPDTEGLNYWTGRIAKGSVSAAEIVNSFIQSKEFLDRGLDRQTSLKLVYQAMFDREADAEGLSYWDGILSNGVSLSYVVGKIATLEEFSTLCNKYGMTPGEVELPAERDQNYALTSFMNKVYQLFLGRDGLPEELNNYVGAAMNGSKRIDGIFNLLLASDESRNKLNTSEKFLNSLFEAAYGHEASSEEYEAKLNSIHNGVTRSRIVKDVLRSEKFTSRLSELGLPKTAIVPEKIIALSWDDGPYRPVTMRILDVLEKYGAHATFFVEGDHVYTYRDCILRATNLDCEIGNHTWDHTRLTSLSAEGVRSSMYKTNEAIYNITGNWPKVMRPAGGGFNDTVVANVGMPMIIWSVDTNDWKYRDTQRCIDWVLNNAKDGDIVLMHDLYPSTAAAAEVIIPELIARGYTLVTISELAEYKGVEMQNGKPYYSMR